MTLKGPMNRFQLTGKIIQAALQVVESQEIVRLELAFEDTSTSAIIIKYPWLQKIVLNMASGIEVVVSGRICIGSEGNIYLVAVLVEPPFVFVKRLDHVKKKYEPQASKEVQS
ncbi:MAG: hypothetical protein WA581_10270 [Candidatus Acidiferrales bacterium]